MVDLGDECLCSGFEMIHSTGEIEIGRREDRERQTAEKLER